MSGPELTFKTEQPNLVFQEREYPDPNDIVDMSLSTGIAVEDIENSHKVLNKKEIKIPFFERYKSIRQEMITQPSMSPTGQPMFGKAVPTEDSILTEMYRSADQSIDRVEADRELGKSIVYGGNVVEALQKWRTFQSQTSLAEQATGVRGLILKNAAVAGPMLKSYWEASPWMFGGAVAGMAIAAIGGQLGPQAAAPEELLSVPAAGYGGATVMMGVSAGASAKLSEYWYLQGVGSFYGEMIDSGADPRIANIIAPIMAIPYAAIEQAQIKQLTPGLRQGLQETVLKSVMTTLRKHGERYIQTLAQETFEEVAQEAVQIAAVDAANFLSDNGLEVDKEYITSRAQRLNVTTIEALKSMALLPLPGAVVDVATETARSLPSGSQTPSQILKNYESKIKDAVRNKEFEKARAYIDLALYEGKQHEAEEKVADDLREIPELSDLWPQVEKEISEIMTPEEAENVLGFQSEQQVQKFAEQKAAREQELQKRKEISEKPAAPSLENLEGMKSFEITESEDKIKLETIEAEEKDKGYGTQAINKLIDYANSVGKKIELKAGRTNEGARALYERLGFKQIASTDPKFTGILMEYVKQPEAQRDILGGLDPVTTILNALREAKKVRPLTEAQQKAERRRRVGAAAGALTKSIAKGKQVEESIFRSTGLLKDPLTEYNQLYESIRDKVEPGAIDAAFLQIYKNPKLRYFEMVNTAEAFRKLIEGNSITPREQELLWNQFGKEFGKQIQDRVPVSPISDQLISLWRAGLLTSPKTSGLNTFSNLSHAVSETASLAVASPVDSVMSLFTKERTTSFTMRGYTGGTIKGFKEGWKYFWTGIDERSIGEKYDYKKINFGTSLFGRVKQWYNDITFHLMGAEDEPFFYGAKARSLFNQAITQAKNKGLKGKARENYINDLMQNPTDEMLDLSDMDAEGAVFQNKTALGDLAKDIQRSRIGKIIVPFGRTPSAVATQIINYSPVGAVKEVVEQIHKGKFDQRKLSMAIGRSIVGIPALYIGAKLVSAGLMNLSYPENEKDRKLWELEGRSPNSVKIGDKERSVFVLGPLGNVLLIGGYFQQALQDEGSPTKAMIIAMSGGAKSFTEQTFVVGINRTIDAITDPERSFEKWFSNMAGSAVPTIVADIARATDDKSRRTEGPIQKIQSRIPSLAQKLEPRVDVLGQDLPRYGGNVLETIIDPTRPSKIRQDVVVDELRRLWDKDVKVSPTLLGDRNGYKILSQQENTQLWHRAGQLTYRNIFDLIQNPSYKNISDEEKGKLIDKAVKLSKDFARAEAVISIINSHPEKEQEMWDSKLLTIDVVNMMKKMGLKGE